MRSRPLAWKLLPTFLAAILLCTFGMAAYAIYSARAFYIDHTAGALQSRARLVEQKLSSAEFSGADVSPSRIHEQVRAMGAAASVRITVIDDKGKVLAESQSDADPRDHSNRPEFIAALRDGEGQAVRYSATLKADMVYGSVRGKDARGRIVVYRAAMPLTEINHAMRDIYMEILVAGAVFAIVAAAVGAVVVRRIARPLREITKGARRLSAGEFAQRLPTSSVREFSDLADSLQHMARQLDEEIRALTAQKNEREAILAGMIEGVLAVDLDERVLSINHAAEEMIQTVRTSVIGKGLSEAVRNLDLAEFVTRVLAGDQSIEEEIILRDTNGQDRFVAVRGAALTTADGQKIGALLVLHDLTRLHRLETMRRDFVANVSHELKTPITSIKGFVETLREGAVEDSAIAGKFLEIIARQADRLNQIIDDLLALSRIERDAQNQQIACERGDLYAVLRSAVDDCRSLSASRDVKVVLQCPAELQVTMNAQLIEQAVVNLLDNAIKYSPPASTVEVTASRQDQWVLVEVKDHGCGIAPEHLDRIFERFYRVDKARSREQGGTGLGLSIVKHIAQAHGGKVDVQSTPGKSSTFVIHLPAGELPG
jgi:two-component system phosphate regulon sensor histidine kinase PhoR